VHEGIEASGVNVRVIEFETGDGGQSGDAVNVAASTEERQKSVIECSIHPSVTVVGFWV
jgi:hypothetical protein